MENPNLEDIAEAFVRMSASPVKADRDAIDRMARELNCSTCDIVKELDDSSLTQTDKPAMKLRVIKPRNNRPLLGAVTGAGMAGIVMLAANSAKIVPSMVLGAITGTATALTAQEEEG